MIINIVYALQLNFPWNQKADKMVGVNLTIITHLHDGEDLINFVIGEFITKCHEHGTELVRVDFAWGSSFERSECCSNNLILIYLTRRLLCKHIQESCESDLS